MAYLTPPRPTVVVRSRVLFPLQPSLSTIADGSGSVAGTIRVDGSPVAGTRVILLQAQTFVRMGWTVTDADGAYAFTGIAPGSYMVVPLDMSGAFRSKVIHTVVP